MIGIKNMLRSADNGMVDISKTIGNTGQHQGAMLGNVRRHVHVIHSLWFLLTPSAKWKTEHRWGWERHFFYLLCLLMLCVRLKIDVGVASILSAFCNCSMLNLFTAHIKKKKTTIFLFSWPVTPSVKILDMLWFPNPLSHQQQG